MLNPLRHERLKFAQPVIGNRVRDVAPNDCVFPKAVVTQPFDASRKRCDVQLLATNLELKVVGNDGPLRMKGDECMAYRRVDPAARECPPAKLTIADFKLSRSGVHSITQLVSLVDAMIMNTFSAGQRGAAVEANGAVFFDALSRWGRRFQTCAGTSTTSIS